MAFSIKLKKFLAVNLFFLIGYFIPWPAVFINAVFGFLWLVLNSLAVGNYLFLKKTWSAKFIYGLLFLSVAAALIGTVSFYLWQLNQFVQIATILIVTLIASLLVKKFPLAFDWEINFKRLNLKTGLLVLFYLFVFAVMVKMLFAGRTADTIRTPWEVLPSEFFVLYFIACLLLFIIIRLSAGGWPLLLISLHGLLSFGVALVVYQVGFDYDPFIHRTNLKLILENNTLLPKPYYYIGQYSLLIFFHKLLWISTDILDKILVPVMAAVYLPATIYHAFKDNFKTSGKTLLSIILLIFAFPFTNFISTTPQALANCLFFITVILALYYINHPKVKIWPLALLVIMTLAVHPLAGIPLFFFLALLIFYKRFGEHGKFSKFLKKSAVWEIVILGILALPTAFIINSFTLSQLKVAVASDWFGNVINDFSALAPQFYYRSYISLLDLVYTYGNNIALVLLSLAIIGYFFVRKHKQLKKYFVYLSGFVVLLGNYLLLSGMVSFFSLVSYEQQNYPRRILELSFYLLLPFIIISLYLLFERLYKQKPTTVFMTIMILSLAASFSLYLSYPRVDKITESHGYSTSQTDIKTVNLIENLEQGEPYVVLAAQPVSAAAISQLGFKYYYNDYFFYPVPTGGRLYQLYEDLAYQKMSTDEIIANVRFLTGVQTVYLVINSYWFDASDIIKADKQSADKWYSIDSKNYIFRYSN